MRKREGRCSCCSSRKSHSEVRVDEEDDDDVHDCNGERLKLERETGNLGV